MCGIIGISARDQTLPFQDFEKAVDTLSHRGPDARGIYEDRFLRLGHRRLSILDLSEKANQPFQDEEKKTVVVFNGEIYNFQEIRSLLEADGFRFRTNSDTEVILHSYRKWGPAALSRFNGMFAFALYDREARKLFLARDRVGKKPLYYLHSGGIFAFSSEIKGLLTMFPMFRKEIDLEAFNFYLAMGYIQGEMSIFRGVRKLPPGHAMLLDLEKGDLKIWRYWEPPPIDFIMDEATLLEELGILLEDAVRARLVSDVPLGAFLSGGIDSSLVVALMCRVSASPVKTFSIGFREGKFNELPYSRIVARHFRTDHHEFIVSQDVASLLPVLASQFDEPFSDSSMFPTYIVARETRNHVTVALTGDGGDELFGGYFQYQFGKIVDGLTRCIPKGLEGPSRSVFRALERVVPVGKSVCRSLGGERNRFFLDTHIKGADRKEVFGEAMMAFLGGSWREPERFMDSAQRALERDFGFLGSLMRYDFDYYLPDDVLVKVDRATMLTGLEARAPLLDYRVAEFALGKIPPSLKVRGMTKKYLLKKLAKRLLPRELNLERKMGFGIPIDTWFRKGAFVDLYLDLLPGKGDPYLDRDGMVRMLDSHRRGKRPLGMFLFSLLMFQQWRRAYGV